MRDTFLYNTALDIVQQYGWEGLRNVTLVFPSHRAGLVLKHELKHLQLAQHPAPVFLPKITTLNELFDSLSPLQQEDELRLICRLYHIYRAVTGESISLDIFYGWGKQIISDFNNIDKAVPPAEIKAFFANTVAARELEDVKLDEEVSRRLKDLLRQTDAQGHTDEQSIQRKYAALWHNLYPIYEQLNQALAAEQKGYEGARMIAALQYLTQHGDACQGAYCFIGFNYLLRVEKALMLWFKEHREGRFYWDYVDGFSTNTKAFMFIEQHLKDLGNAAKPWLLAQAKEVDIISTTTGNAQAQFVSPWLQQHYTRKGEQTAIVICDEQMLEPVIYALPSLYVEGVAEAVPINITKGFPLSNTQVYARVMAALEQYAIEKGNALTPTEVQGVLSNLLVAVDETANALPSNRHYEIPSQHVEDWHTLLLRESVYQIRCAINSFALLAAEPLLHDAITSMRVLRHFIKQYLQGISLPFNGEPITDIQVMGVLETRMLDFDNLLLLNVEEGVVPQQQADLSFIPYYLRKTYHIPTRDEGALVYAYNFFRLLMRAKHTTLVFSEAETAMGRKSMSRFIMQMLVNPAQFSVHKFSLAENTGSQGTHMEEQTVSQSRTLTSLSPSAISTYIECPRKFYWLYIECLRPTEPDTLIFAPNTMGTFVHQVMEDLYKPYMGKGSLDAQWLEQIAADDTYLTACLATAYREVNEADGTSYDFDSHQMENIVMIEFIKNILRRDATDAKQYGLEILMTEERCAFALNGVRIGGIIDRMDRLGNMLRIVDYKTGSYDVRKLSTSWEDLLTQPDAHYVLQTLIYSEAALRAPVFAHTSLPEDSNIPGSAICPNLYFTQRNLSKLDSRVGIDGEPITDYHTVRDRFLHLLTEKVQTICQDTDYVPLADGECSPYCPFLQLCHRKPKEN